MFGERLYHPRSEKLAIAARDELILMALFLKKDIIIDDMNLTEHNKTHIEWLLEVNDITGVTITYKSFQEVPLETCIERDAKRPNPVGARFIRKCWREWVVPSATMAIKDSNKLTVVICDVDGTLAIRQNRGIYDFDNCDSDAINTVVQELLAYNLRPVIITTGREFKYYGKTLAWLKSHSIHPIALLMRPDGDTRKDSIVKKELYETYIKDKYNVQFVFDDRNDVVDMWREQGLTCLQVADGDF
jgi:hypothetical protein